MVASEGGADNTATIRLLLILNRRVPGQGQERERSLRREVRPGVESVRAGPPLMAAVHPLEPEEEHSSE